MMTQREPVTVFGGTGYLGSQIVKALIKGGHRVRIASRHAGHEPMPAGTEAVTCDIRDTGQVRQAVDGARAVVNAVSLYHEQGDASFYQIHVKAAERIAHEAAQADVSRLVLISGIGASEHSSSAYVRARGAGERVTRQQFPDATVLRPSVLFDQTGGLVANLERVTRAPVVPLFGRGHTRLQPAHVGDVAQAVVRVLGRERTQGRIFELGGGIHRFRDCVRMDLAHRGRRRLLIPVPFMAWHALALVLGRLPEPQLTRDQVILMASDNVVGEGCPSFDDLGIEPRGLGHVLSEPSEG